MPTIMTGYFQPIPSGNHDVTTFRKKISQRFAHAVKSPVPACSGWKSWISGSQTVKSVSMNACEFETGHRGVMVVPLVDHQHFMIIREYLAGTEDYQLTLPKGLAEPGEPLQEVGNRELKEEIGFGARYWHHLGDFSLSPNYNETQYSWHRICVKRRWRAMNQTPWKSRRFHLIS